VVGSRWYRC